MGPPIFQASGIARIEWDVSPVGDGDRRTAQLTFLDSKGRPQKRGLRLDGLQISDWTLREGIYDRCDQVRVIDSARTGGQLEFGCYTVQFFCHGNVAGEHLADGVIVQM